MLLNMLLNALVILAAALFALYIALIKSEKFADWFDNLIDPALDYLWDKFSNDETEE